MRGSGRFGDEVNMLPVPGIDLRFFGRPSHSLVTVPTALFRLPVYYFCGEKYKYGRNFWRVLFINACMIYLETKFRFYSVE